MLMDNGTWQAYSPWGHKEFDTTESLSTAHNLKEHIKSHKKKKKHWLTKVNQSQAGMVLQRVLDQVPIPCLQPLLLGLEI